MTLILAFQQTATADTDTFIDDDNSRWEGFIETAKSVGIVNGCNPPDNDRFCPDQVVTRGTMAVMIARAIGAEDTGADHFVDDDGHYAEGAIEALIGTGARFGCEVERFCPDRAITRGEMAAFITRTLKWDTSEPSPDWLDLDTSTLSGALAELAQRGVIEACDPPADQRLCPRQLVERDEAVATLVKALGLTASEVATQTTELAPIDFGDSFDELSLWDGRSPSYRNRVSLTSDGFKASALDVAIPKGSHFGADFRLDFSRTLDDEPETLFFRYFLRLDRDWATASSGKLPGFSGVYGRSGKGGYQSRPWEPGWSARLMFRPTSEDDRRVRIGYYVYHLGQQRQYGDGLLWNQAGRLLPGEWYCLEGEIEMNTPGLSDGALRAWVDGTPAFDSTGLEFRRPTEPEIRIESFWFNVYYGGKSVPERDLGLTIDELVVDSKRIGCEVGEGTSQTVSADFDADGYDDRVRWADCPGGSCFKIETLERSAGARTVDAGAGAWFSLESHRLGLASGDVNGDGSADVAYRGRCIGSVPCWRVHEVNGNRVGFGQNWGDGARFSPSTASLTLGDWNGDGLDDLVYQGICGNNALPCWRVHLSDGDNFVEPRDWGETHELPLIPVAADVNGDGTDDLLYEAPCDVGSCWFVQESLGDRFAKARRLGQAREFEVSQSSMFDFDGNGSDDLVTWQTTQDRSRIEIRYSRPGGLTRPVLLAELDEEVRDVVLRRLEPRSPAQALVEVTCRKGASCVQYLVSPKGDKLANPETFSRSLRARYRLPPIV